MMTTEELMGVEEASVPLEPQEQTGSKAGLTIRVPACCANLGPGFETLALAIKQYLTVTVSVQAPHKGQGIKITTNGELASQLPTDNSNLIAKVLEQVWLQDPRLLPCLSVGIETDFLPYYGLGYSAAATTAAVTAALALGGVQLEKGRIFAEATKYEGNAASAGASIFGGFMICAPNIVPGDILARKLTWSENWSLIATIPPYTIPAKKARAALPASVSHKDAVYNVQKMALMIEAVAAADNESMKAALKDKLQDPYKGKLVPELAEVRKLLQEHDVLGSVLSGGGPTILTIVESTQKPFVIKELEKWATAKKNSCRIMALEIDQDGLVVAD
ncbi:MAG: homoserine kinase [Candidatus Obscuribacterales bacterium]|nr:homoserine kinase [Candidatus Obscuribacterales bacterium]